MHFLRPLFVLMLLILSLPVLSAEDEGYLLQQKISAIAKQYHCDIGVTAVHIETHQKISVNGDKHFLMASTVKVPIALALLKKVDDKKDHLDRMIRFDQGSYVPGGRLANELTQHKGVMKKSLKELMQLMLVISDNTATDLILRELQGPRTVAQYLQSFGFSHIFIRHSIVDLYLSASGLTAKPHQSKSLLVRKADRVTPATKVKAWKALEQQKSDTATSDDMARLLVQLYQGKLASPENTTLLLTLMSQCQTGHHRLKGLLPTDVTVAHKTGTWSLSNSKYLRYQGSKQLNRYVHDIGIVSLPKNKGHLAIAFFVKSKAVSDQGRDRVIALVTRDLYDYFMQDKS